MNTDENKQNTNSPTEPQSTSKTADEFFGPNWRENLDKIEDEWG